MRVYGHVIEELEDRPQLPAEDAILAARESSQPLPEQSEPAQEALFPTIAGDPR
jgi:hypothetical protein